MSDGKRRRLPREIRAYRRWRLKVGLKGIKHELFIAAFAIVIVLLFRAASSGGDSRGSLPHLLEFMAMYLALTGLRLSWYIKELEATESEKDE